MGTTRIILAAAFVAFLGLLAPGSAPAAVRSVVYEWTAPTEGTEAVGYEVEIRFAENRGAPFSEWFEIEEVAEPRAEFLMDMKKCYEVRVRAVDADGRRGPYSVPSADTCDP